MMSDIKWLVIIEIWVLSEGIWAFRLWSACTSRCVFPKVHYELPWETGRVAQALKGQYLDP